jgi:hypothetical protein
LDRCGGLAADYSNAGLDIALLIEKQFRVFRVFRGQTFPNL